MAPTQTQPKTLILGAGLTGVALSRKLTELGLSNLIIEKSRGVGGRLASRRIYNNVFDHGSQHIELFASGSADFKKFITAPEDTVLWDQNKDHSFYSYQSGMTSLLKHHSRGLDITFNTKITEIFRTDNLWNLKDENSKIYTANNLVLTAPLTQSLKILADSKINYPQELNKISYAKKIVLLVSLKQTETYKFSNPDIKKIYLQNSKRDNPDTTYTLVMNDQFSNENFELPDADLNEKVRTVLNSDNLVNQNLIELQVKKWRYAYPLNGLNLPYLQVSNNIYLAGDVFAGTELQESALKVISPKFNPGNNTYNSAISLAKKITSLSSL